MVTAKREGRWGTERNPNGLCHIGPVSHGLPTDHVLAGQAEGDSCDDRPGSKGDAMKLSGVVCKPADFATSTAKRGQTR